MKKTQITDSDFSAEACQLWIISHFLYIFCCKSSGCVC